MQSNRQITPECRKFVKGWEAFIGYPYDDADSRAKKTVQASWTKNKKGQNIGSFGGVITIGYGHTGNDIFPGMTLTEPQAETLLIKKLAEYENAIYNAVHVPLNDNQFGALVAWCYNVGVGAAKSSSLVKKLNAGDYDCVPLELMKWTKSANPNQKKGLVNRRSAECGLWAKGSYVSGSARPVQPRKSVSAPVGAVGTAASGGGLGLMSLVNDSKETLTQYAEITYIQYACVALTVVGIGLTGYAAWKRWRDNKA